MSDPNAAESGLSILVVEDNADAAESCAVLLRVWGHRVTTARDGPTALLHAAASVPDVALIDIGLPRMDGYEVARRLREQSSDRRPFMVAITGHGMADDRVRAARAGIDLHLLKPVEPELLLDLLRSFERVVGGSEPAMPDVQ
jgi:CheY-like chemotaxis protein